MAIGEWSDTDFGALPSVVVAAHELKSPLALIRQMSLMLEEGELSEAESSRLQKQISLNAEQALSLVSDLSQTANLSPGLFPLEPVNPFSVCRQIASETRSMQFFYGKQITWPRSRRRNDLVVANRDLLGRILANFINNAVRYSESGIDIQIKVAKKGDMVRFAVRDYGPRISKAEYRRLIDQMSRRKSTRTRPDSSGLGVYVASQFAKAMDGRIGLLRHMDGLTFYVELPISRQMSLI